MENASKALIMAGSILITVMILSTAVMLVRMFGNFGTETAKKLYANKLEEFNTQFTKHINTKVTAHDIVTLANLAYQNNIDFIDDQSILSNPTELKNATEATENNLFVNIKVHYKGIYIDENGTEKNIEYPEEIEDIRFDLKSKNEKDNFLNNYSIQRQYPEKSSNMVRDDAALLNTNPSLAEPLPVYFLCTECHVSEKTKRVYSMVFESYYYKPNGNQRKKNEIVTNLTY